MNDQILAERRQTWGGVSRLLFWGTIEALVLTLVTVLFAVNGPSVGLGLLGAFLIVGTSILVVTRLLARH